MFYPERIKRIRLLVHDSMKARVVKHLHELGDVQITDFKEKLTAATWQELLGGHPASADSRTITAQLMAVNRLIDMFAMVDPEREEGFFKSLFAPEPPVKVPVEDLSGEKLFDEVSRVVASVEREVEEPLKNLESMELKKDELMIQREFLEKIRPLDVPLEALGRGELINVVLGVAPTRSFAALEADLQEVTEGVVFFAEAAVSDTESCILIISLVSRAEEVAACLRKVDLEKMPAIEFAGNPEQALAELGAALGRLDEDEQRCRRTISAAADRWRLRLKSLRELLYIERQRADIYTSFAKTDYATAIEGWVTAKKAAAVTSQIERCCDGLAIVQITDPEEPAEQLPVSLANPGFLKHFELLVKLYAPPKYDEIDPTVVIFPSFLFFFGLMITDAMYGLMTLLLGVFILRGGGKYFPLYKSAGLLLTLGGISTVILGATTGGWFGNLATEYLGMEFLNKLVILNPMVDVSRFLLFAIGVGLLHLNIGIVLGIIKDVRRNDIPEALKNVWIFFLEAALVCYYFKAQTAAAVCAVPAILLLLYSAKGMALFGVTGLLGDTLSYARLMALGLVSFGLAVAINALAKMVLGIGAVGWLCALVIMVAGHIFSFVLNLMGAFAHGVRLHFVEFFGKFYSGGGEEFEPFCIKREITEIK